MGRDRQEKKLKNSRKVKSDRDQNINFPGSIQLQSPDEGREQQRQ